MPKVHKDWKSVEKQLCDCINKALGNEVAKKVKEVEREVIESEVYDVYQPSYYNRRGAHGGLEDTSNMYSEVNSGILEVVNLTPPNPHYDHSALKSKFINYAVEQGRDYNVYNPGARPFTEKTVEKLEQTQKHVDALKKGLKRQGLKAD